MTPVVPPFQVGEGFGTLGSSFQQPTLPEPVSWTPATFGAWATLAVLALGVLALVALGIVRFRKRAPRRAALRELASLERRAADPATRTAALERLAVLLKSTALASFGRLRVAALSGERWRAFLAETAPSAGFAGPAGAALVRLSERGAAAVDNAEPLFAASRAWLRQHRAHDSGLPGRTPRGSVG